jgi:hypothetical protein
MLLLLFASDPIAARIGHWPESVDLIELNNKYSKDGKHTFTQVIFWERHPGDGKYHVRDWYLVEERESLNGIPVRNAKSDRWDSVFVKQGVYHHVTSKLFKESFTQFDPEVEDKRKWPSEMRRPLSDPCKSRIPADP